MSVDTTPMPGRERERGQNGDSPNAPRHPADRHPWRSLMSVVVLAVAAHSIVLGTLFLWVPLWTLDLVGWEYAGQAFWPSQAGLFLLILGVAYVAAVRLRPLTWLVIGSKLGAFVFLVASGVWGDAPRLVAFLGCGDGLMGLAVAITFRLSAGTTGPEHPSRR